MIVRSISENVKRIEDTETQIRLAIKKGYFANSANLLEKVNKLIEGCVKELPEGMRENTRKSLQAFAQRLYSTLRLNLGANGLAVAWALSKALKGGLTYKEMLTLKQPIITAKVLPEQPFEYGTTAKGVPNGIWSRQYIKNVNKVMQRMADEQSLDANDIERRNSLRNYAEMYERNAYHEQELAGLKKDGTKLVICSVHQDCSDRCFKWQGRVYSLDGTYGKTADGREYVPLEVATNQNQVYYTNPKTNTQYRGGLFGYNCRHRIYAFTGQIPPTVTKAEQQKENKINQKQRAYENEIRKWRERALVEVDPKERREAKQKAVALNKEYIAFSLKNDRAYYPDRCKVLFDNITD